MDLEEKITQQGSKSQKKALSFLDLGLSNILSGVKVDI